MAIRITNSQGTKVYIAALGTDVLSPAAIKTAIAGAHAMGCIQDLGSISTSRKVTEYTCLSSNDASKAIGSVTLGNISVQLLFDADDTAGQDALRTMYLENENRLFIVELTDQITPITGNPSYFTFNGAVSSEEVVIAKDSAVLYNVTVEITSFPDFSPAW